MIPKNIFFFYDTEYDSLHPKLKENIEFVKNQNPDYTVKLYNNETFKEYLKTKGSNNLRYFNSLNPNMPSLLSDYFRYNILYFEGGVYLDIKSRPAKPIRDIITDDSKLWLCFASKQELDIMGCFMMSAKDSPFFKLVIDKFHTNVDIYHTLDLNVNAPKKNILRLFATYMLADIVRDNHIPNVIKCRDWRKYGIVSCVNTSKRIFSMEHTELYDKPHYRTVHQHLILK
jgi:hypothetical protein